MVGVMQFGGIEQETPIDGELLSIQRVPPEVKVHGLAEQVAILLVSPAMSIADSELMMVTESAEESM